VSRSILRPATTRTEWGIDPTMAADRQISNVVAVWARMPGAAQVSRMLAPPDCGDVGETGCCRVSASLWQS